MSGHGKRYKAARAKIDRENLYTPVEAIRILKDIEGAKFDETVEVHFRLGLNVRHADEQLRGTLQFEDEPSSFEAALQATKEATDERA